MGRVLVVDDEQSMREFLASCLRRAGHEVAVADTGVAALASLDKKPVDVVVTDLRMPGDLDGLGLLKAIKGRQIDVAYSFKVLAHVEHIHAAMAKMARVVRPGGWVLAEFYNARSLRRLVKALKRPTAISEDNHDHAVFTRYDSVDDVRSYLPPELEWVTSRGIRVITPVAKALELPFVGGALRWAEHRLADLPIARDLGGFLVAVCRKR